MRARSTGTIAFAAGLVLATTLPQAIAADPPSSQTIRYQGTSVTVPASWPVYDLAADPTRCVRFDQHAVYLGHPGTDQNCPAHAVGHTTAVLLEPYDTTARDHVLPGDGQVQALSENKKVMVTASYGAGGPSAAADVLAATARSATKPRSSTAPPKQATPAPMPAAKTYTGRGFDACAAPSTAAMKAWSQSSPYRAVGIYVGGVNRACGLGNLTTAWVKSVRSYGFHFIPTYVGLQAPCAGFSQSISTNTKTAESQGDWAAQDAVRAMKALAMPAGSPVYIDVEQYSGTAACSNAVVHFVSGWVKEIHILGYRGGYYSSRVDDIAANVHTAGIAHPDALWYARWNMDAGVYGVPGVADSLWRPHKRLHQYSGSHNARYGGKTLNIDSDQVDGPIG